MQCHDFTVEPFLDWGWFMSRGWVLWLHSPITTTQNLCGSNWCHQYKMARLVWRIFWLYFCTMGGNGEVLSIFRPLLCPGFILLTYQKGWLVVVSDGCRPWLWRLIIFQNIAQMSVIMSKDLLKSNYGIKYFIFSFAPDQINIINTLEELSSRIRNVCLYVFFGQHIA